MTIFAVRQGGQDEEIFNRRNIFNIFLFGVVDIIKAEHTKEYLEWQKKNIKSLQLVNRCLEVKKGIKELVDGIKEKYNGSQYDLKAISDYIEWLHKKFFIINRDNDLSKTKISDIPFAMVSDRMALEWFIEELLKAMKPFDDIALHGG